MKTAIALLLLVVSVASADSKPATKPAATPDVITEREAMLFEIAVLKGKNEQAVCETACMSQLPAYKKANDDIRSLSATIDAAHHIDRNAGDKFNYETRKIERGVVPPPKK